MIDRRHRYLCTALGCAGLVLVCAKIPAVAQYEDDTLDDHERQDQRYLERYRQKEAEPESPAETDDASRAEAFLAKADELIRDKNYRSFTTERFRVQTDDPRVDPKAVASLLDGFHDYFSEFWAGTLELKPQSTLSRVFLFYSFHKYNQLLAGDWRFSEVRPKGHYLRGVNAITLHSDSAAASDLADVLVHEEAHQLFGERLFVEPRSIPTWLTEGLATYFGFSYMDEDGRFHPGEIGGKKVALMRGASAEPGRESKQRLSSLKKSVRSKTEGSGLLDVIRLDDPNEFYARSEWTYSASWILVHYLIHGDDGLHLGAFSRYLIRASHGDGGPEALLAELNVSAEELEASATSHLKRLKAR